ncbi:hypothetical protein LSH36_558g00031 [Paralvinella palmiformis]|uniref:Major facilitator superfamily (MFS) profile domain-containing protein n=1 Tax=Paralvinella palmiformis TaxID=53620 RepID=A0AAD9J6F1_9ANNE|nr:hypothetical protein LSH36_558g00031 [Paralvinella palmiformis]
MGRVRRYRSFGDTEPQERNNVDPGIEAASFTKGAATYTVDEAIEKIGFGWFQVKLSFVAGLAWMADSMELMVLSILGPELLCQWQISTTEEAFLTTIVFMGFGIGSPILGYMADYFGRKTALIMAASWAAFFGMLSSLAPFYSWLLILRGLTGLGLAGVPQSVTYYSEFLPSKYRGKCIILLEFFWALGAFLEVALAMLLVNRFSWRPWVLVTSLPLLIFIPACLLSPESPRYLAACGRTKEAQKILIHIAKCNGSSLPSGTLIIEPETPRGRIKDLFTPEYRRSTFLIWIIWFVATLSYYGIVMLSTELIKTGPLCITVRGLPSASDHEESCKVGCHGLTQANYVELLWTSSAELPGLLLTAIYVDYIGRRTALVINFLVFSLTTFLMLICVSNRVMILELFITRALIASGLQIGFVYTPELYPTVIRAIGIGIANIFARIGAIITPFLAQLVSSNIPVNNTIPAWYRNRMTEYRYYLIRTSDTRPIRDRLGQTLSTVSIPPWFGSREKSGRVETVKMDMHPDEDMSLAFV